MNSSQIASWKKETTWTWAILVVLTLLGPLLGKTAVGIAVLGVGLLKFFGILFFFMEVRGAHRFWAILPMTIACICFTFIAIILRN